MLCVQNIHVEIHALCYLSQKMFICKSLDKASHSDRGKTKIRISGYFVSRKSYHFENRSVNYGAKCSALD